MPLYSSAYLGQGTLVNSSDRDILIAVHLVTVPELSDGSNLLERYSRGSKVCYGRSHLRLPPP